MAHLITESMLEAAAKALTGHGTRPNGDGCLCGHDATPVRRHLAEVVAAAIGPALCTEMMTVLAQILPEPTSRIATDFGAGFRPPLDTRGRAGAHVTPREHRAI